MDMFACIASVSDLLTSKSKLVLVDKRLYTKLNLPLPSTPGLCCHRHRVRQFRPRGPRNNPGPWHGDKEARPSNTLTISLDAAKVSHQDDQRAPHLTISQFLFDRDTSNGGTSSLRLDEWSPSAFNAIEVLRKGCICHTYMKYV
jgi:hypothetical protein